MMSGVESDAPESGPPGAGLAPGLAPADGAAADGSGVAAAPGVSSV